MEKLNDILKKTKEASKILNTLSTDLKNQAIVKIANALILNKEEIIKQNFATQEEDLKVLLNTYKTTEAEQHRNQIDAKLRDLALKRSEMQERKGIITRMTQEEVEAYIRLAQRDRNAYNDIMGQTSEDTRKQLETIGRIIDQNGYIPENSMKQVANITSDAFKNLNSSEWGGDLVRGIARGMNNNNSFLSKAVNFAVSTITSKLHFSRPDEGPLRNYEKWMPDFVQGLTRTLNASTPSLYKSINKMAGKMKDELSLGFAMSPTLNNVSSYNPSINVTIHNNMETDFMGNLVSNIKTFSNGSKNDYNYGMS